MIHSLTSDSVLLFVGMWALKTTAILAVAMAVTWALRRASSAVRHLVWLIALCSILTLPILAWALPEWRLPAWQVSVAPPVVTTRGEPISAVVPPRPDSKAGTQEQTVSSGATWDEGDSLGRWSYALVTIWLIGAAALGLRVFLRIYFLRRTARRELHVLTDGRILKIVTDSAAHSGLRGPIALVTGGHHFSMPMTWGFWRPVVLLPQEAFMWDVARLRAVLLHELAHVRRGDWLSVLLSQIVCALLWFHPLVWMAGRALRLEAEQAADDCVITAGIRPSEYGSELLAILRLSTKRNTTTNERNISMTPAISMAQPQTIEQRIRALLDEKRSRRTVGRGTLAMAFTATVAAMIPLAALQLTAAEPTPASAPSTPASVDLSTPESALRTFIAALNRGDLENAAATVHGGRHTSINPGLAARFAEGRPQFEVSGVTTAVEGESSTVTIAQGTISSAASASADAKQKVEKQGEQRLPFRREGEAWKIVPLNAEESKGPNQASVLLTIASALAASDEVLAQFRVRAAQTQCINHLKQLAIAAHMYAQAHDGRLDFTAETAMKALLPMLENNEKLLRCPSSEKVRYVFNEKLAKRTFSQITNPARTVLFYEAVEGEATLSATGAGAANGPSLPHEGVTNVAFADGHVESIRAKDVAALRWEP